MPSRHERQKDSVLSISFFGLNRYAVSVLRPERSLSILNVKSVIG